MNDPYLHSLYVYMNLYARNSSHILWSKLNKYYSYFHEQYFSHYDS